MNAPAVRQCSESCKMHWNKFVLVIIIIILSGNVLSTFKRRLVFNKGSHFFVRLNLRQDLFKSTPTFIHGIGFKMTWDLPDKVNFKNRVQRRDLTHGIETLLNQHKFNGKMCIRRFLCESQSLLKYNKDFMSRLLVLIFGSEGRMENSMQLSCAEQISECPLTLVSFIH